MVVSERRLARALLQHYTSSSGRTLPFRKTTNKRHEATREKREKKRLSLPGAPTRSVVPRRRQEPLQPTRVPPPSSPRPLASSRASPRAPSGPPPRPRLPLAADLTQSHSDDALVLRLPTPSSDGSEEGRAAEDEPDAQREFARGGTETATPRDGLNGKDDALRGGDADDASPPLAQRSETHAFEEDARDGGYREEIAAQRPASTPYDDTLESTPSERSENGVATQIGAMLATLAEQERGGEEEQDEHEEDVKYDELAVDGTQLGATQAEVATQPGSTAREQSEREAPIGAMLATLIEHEKGEEGEQDEHDEGDDEYEELAVDGTQLEATQAEVATQPGSTAGERSGEEVATQIGAMLTTLTEREKGEEEEQDEQDEEDEYEAAGGTQLEATQLEATQAEVATQLGASARGESAVEAAILSRVAELRALLNRTSATRFARLHRAVRELDAAP